MIKIVIKNKNGQNTEGVLLMKVLKIDIKNETFLSYYIRFSTLFFLQHSTIPYAEI
jgi:hypothetical protein